MDFDYENGTVELDVSPAMSRICDGIDYRGVIENREEIERATQQILKGFLDSVAKSKGLPNTDQRVKSLTRQYLIRINIEANARR